MFMAVTSWPFILTSPQEISTSLSRHRISVDLPLPERPMTMKTSPGLTVKDTPRTATTDSLDSSSAAIRSRSSTSKKTSFSE